MAQLTLYLDAETQEKVCRAARLEGVSLSRWAREKLSIAAGCGRDWPDNFFALFGSVSDPTFEKAEKIPADLDIKREEL